MKGVGISFGEPLSERGGGEGSRKSINHGAGGEWRGREVGGGSDFFH